MHPVAISFSIIRFPDAVQSCPDTIAICQEELLPRYCGKQGLRGMNSSVFWEENSKRISWAVAWQASGVEAGNAGPGARSRLVISAEAAK